MEYSVACFFLDEKLSRNDYFNMSTHITAEKGMVAECVLLPGDPLRAEHIASTFFKNPVKYNETRGMYGFTGEWNGTEYLSRVQEWECHHSRFMPTSL